MTSLLSPCRGIKRLFAPEKHPANPLPLAKSAVAAALGRRQFLSMLAGSLGALAIQRGAPNRAPDESDFNLANFRSLSLRTARNCVSRDGDWVRPGGPYFEMYIRDAFWIVLALRDGALSTRVYRRITEQQYADGQIPTMLLREGGRERKEDESTLVYLLWTYHLWRSGVRIQSEPVFKAWRFVERQVNNGRYVTGPGTFHYWLDTLAFGGPDVIAYNQGLYAVAARCARQMGVEPSAAKPTVAEQQYRALYKPQVGAITLSEKTDLLDVSCLVGEYMSYHLLGQPILLNEQVRSTVGRFAVVNYPEGDFLGFKVCSHLDGEYLDPPWLPESTDNLQGEYQNGASWLLYDALALGAAARHGDPNARPLLMARLRSEVRSERYLHEYLSTHPYSPHFGVGPAYRRDYGWSAFAYRVGEEIGLVDEEPVLA